MRRRIAAALSAVALALGAAEVTAQARPGTPAVPAAPTAPGAPPPEIKVDEATALKVAALEARMSAVLANFALLQRQAQDLQQEMAKLIEERKTLVQDAARRGAVDVKDPNEWLFDNKGQRFVRNPRATGGGTAPTR